MEVIEPGDQLGRYSVRMIPDPRRYTKTERDGETLYIDKYLGHAFTLDAMAAGFAGVPIYALSPRIESTKEYAESRLSALSGELVSGEYTPPSEDPAAHHELDTGGGERLVGFLSVDICGATAMRRRSAAAFDRAYELFTRELGTVVGQFNGSILKTKGDGFIAFIDHPSFNNACDALIDMGVSVLAVLHHSLNPALVKSGITPLNIRIGADFGEAIIKQVSIPATGFTSREVLSDALNRAVKIEEACPPDEFWIGRCLYELIHVQWLERANQTAFDGAQVGMPGYQTYRIT
jgi:class 3 adenylate cyclase